MSEREILIDRIKQRMDNISKEATANGMTPEILASILDENLLILIDGQISSGRLG